MLMLVLGRPIIADMYVTHLLMTATVKAAARATGGCNCQGKGYAQTRPTQIQVTLDITNTYADSEEIVIA